MRINNPDFGIKPWRKPARRQKFTIVIDQRTGFELHFPRQLQTPQGQRVQERIIAFMTEVPEPPEPEQPRPA